MVGRTPWSAADAPVGLLHKPGDRRDVFRFHPSPKTKPENVPSVPGFFARFAISDGKVDGDKTSFTVKREFNGNSINPGTDGTFSGFTPRQKQNRKTFRLSPGFARVFPGFAPGFCRPRVSRVLPVTGFCRVSDGRNRLYLPRTGQEAWPTASGESADCAANRRSRPGPHPHFAVQRS